MNIIQDNQRKSMKGQIKKEDLQSDKSGKNLHILGIQSSLDSNLEFATSCISHKCQVNGRFAKEGNMTSS